MFQLLRKMIAPIMLTVLVAFVATIIFSWGGGGFQGGPDDTIGIIDGEKITFREFDIYYTNLYRQEQEESEDEVTAEKAAELRQQAWNQMIAERLMQKEMARRGIFVTDREIFDFLRMYPPSYIQNIPQFQTDGQFDQNKYLAAMNSPEFAPFWAQVEAQVSEDLKKYKLQEQVLATVRTTPAEVMEAFLADRENVKIGYINILNDLMEPTVPEVTDEEKRAYYESNKEDYLIGRRATLDVVKFAKVPSDTDWEIVRSEIKDIYDSIMAGGDFAELAEIYSEDVSAANGGDLGWFGRGRMVKAFDSAVFAMEIEEVSPPVRTQFGWHLIKLLDVKTEEEIPRGKSEPEMVEKRQAAHILLKTSPSDGTLDMIVENATYLVDSARTMGLKEAAELFNYEVTTTMAFVEDGFISRDLSRNEEANKFAFSHEAGAVAEPIETNDAVFVIAVDSRLPESYTDYEDTQGSIARILLMEKANKMAGDTARVIYDAIMAGSAPGQAAERFGFEYLRSQMINRNSALPGLGSDPNVIGGAFALMEINEVSQPIEHTKGYAILTLLDRQSPDLTEFNELRDSVYMAVMIEKQQDAYNRWFEVMVQNTEIESRIDKFFSGS